MVNSCETRMPTTRAMSGSSTPARIMAPSRVRSSSIQRPIATTTAMTMIGEPVERETPAARTAQSRRARPASCNVDRIAAPHHQAEIGDHERDAERHQHLRQLHRRAAGATSRRSISPPNAATSSVATIAASQKLNLTPSKPTTKRRAEIGAEHEQRAVRQVRNPHQPENQRETRRQQKQQSAEGDAVDRQHQPKGHGRRDLALVSSFGCVRSRLKRFPLRDMRREPQAPRRPRISVYHDLSGG